MENELNLTIYKKQILTVSSETIKSKKLWQQQIGQLSQEEKKTE